MDRERSSIVIRVTSFIRMGIHRRWSYIEKNLEQPFGKFHEVCGCLLISEGKLDAPVG
jgi:hypothetical protein